jgi:ribonuclease P protein component
LGRESGGLVLVMRKSLGTAVLRNRLKRRLRAAKLECPPISGSVVVLPQPAAARAPYRDLREELAGLLLDLR